MNATTSHNQPTKFGTHTTPISGSCGPVEARVAMTLAEFNAFRADRDRMDWLQQGRCIVNKSTKDGVYFCANIEDEREDWHKTVREAIDAARKL